MICSAPRTAAGGEPLRMSTVTLRLEAYDKEAQRLIAAAQALADERKNPDIEPLHALYRMLERSEPVQVALGRGGVEASDALLEAEVQLRKLPKNAGGVSYFSPKMHDLLARAEGEAARDRGALVTPLHLLMACSQETTGPVQSVFRSVSLTGPIVRALATGSDLSTPSTGTNGSFASGGKGVKGDLLEQYGRDLVKLATEDALDPVIGRDEELRRILQVLARRYENAPLLVGESGIGKMSIVHALAMRIARGEVPTLLAKRRLIALELPALLAGAKLRGEAEDRMRQLIVAVKDGDVLLVLPDLGQLFGERAPSGAGAILGAALARGELRAIGIATPDVVKKGMEHDPTLIRRFVAIEVEAPTPDQAISICRGVVGRYEAMHGVKISDPAILAAVRFARRYVPAATLPKAAIDLLDEAAARVRVEVESVPSDIDAIEQRLVTLRAETKSLEDDLDDDSKRQKAKLDAEIEELTPKAAALRAAWSESSARASAVKKLAADLEAAQRAHEAARAAGDQAKAGELRFGTIPLLEKQLEEARGPDGSSTSRVRDRVLESDVADVVATWTGVPVAKMMEAETEKLLRMEEHLGKRVIGQGPAVLAVSKAVRRGRVGLRDPRKPIGSFLFLGPTGVGKTELAKALAEFLFDDDASLTRLDMSEFMEKHMVARLLGSPPGYVDSEEGGFLTEAVRRRPYSVVLFDEMEKAHPDVFNILLQVLDDGRLTDSRGQIAHFSDTVIIMTSNVGGHAILDHGEGVTREAIREKLEGELKKHFRPEFLNRIDDVVIFDPLGKGDLRGVIEIQLAQVQKLLADRRIVLDVTPAAKDKLVDLGYEPAFGARPLKRVIVKHLQDPLAEEILRGGYTPGDTVRVDVNAEGGLVFTHNRSA
jgi:ATP-dependent Clp protease ATP-binding subunit ClpB